MSICYSSVFGIGLIGNWCEYATELKRNDYMAVSLALSFEVVDPMIDPKTNIDNDFDDSFTALDQEFEARF